MSVLLALVAGSAIFVNGNELYADCSGDNARRLRCAAYITGVADAVAITEDATNRFTLCVPVGSSRGQLLDITVNYLRDNPERRHLNAGAITYVALKEAFPCPS